MKDLKVRDDGKHYRNKPQIKASFVTVVHIVRAITEPSFKLTEEVEH